MRTLRISVWILEALIMAVAALAVAIAGRSADVAPVLLVGGIVLAILGITAFILGRRTKRVDWTWFEHARARRRALRIARRAAIALFLVFILAMGALLIFSSGFASPLVAALVPVGAIAAFACVVGATIEVFAPTPQAAPKRTIVPVNGQGRDLSWVERAIDARQWEDGQEPTPDDVESALQRWNKTNGKGTS